MKKIFYKDENDLKGNVKVYYKGVEYTTGNRNHEVVELYHGGKFIKVVKIKDVFSVIKEYKIYLLEVKYNPSSMKDNFGSKILVIANSVKEARLTASRKSHGFDSTWDNSKISTCKVIGFPHKSMLPGVIFE